MKAENTLSYAGNKFYVMVICLVKRADKCVVF